MIEKIVFSTKAYLDIINEVYSYLNVETGGIFLGHLEDDTCYILEMIDPGYQNITRNYAFFEYDQAYVTHLANVTAKKYKNMLKVVGLWHRHPGSMDTFSSTDDETNKKFANLDDKGAISALVNLDPSFRLTIYHVNNSKKSNSLTNNTLLNINHFLRPKYTKMTNILIGDKHIKEDFLSLKTQTDIMKTDVLKYVFEKKSLLNFNYYKPTQDINIQDKIFEALDYELDFLENQKEYSFKIYPFDYDKNLIKISLKLNFNIQNYPNNINFYLFYENETTKYKLQNDEFEKHDICQKQSHIKSFINEYKSIKFHKKQEKENLIFINNLLEKLNLDSLKLDENYKLEQLKKVKKEVLKLLHTDRKNNNETQNETLKIDEIAKKFNAIMSDLLRKEIHENSNTSAKEH